MTAAEPAGLPAGTVVWVPFPHGERQRMTVRPALVVSHRPTGPDGLLVWALMITNAARARWPGDIPVPDHAAAGLPVPSVIRTAKIATIEARVAEPAGTLPHAMMAAVNAALAATMRLPAG